MLGRKDKRSRQNVEVLAGSWGCLVLVSARPYAVDSRKPLKSPSFLDESEASLNTLGVRMLTLGMDARSVSGRVPESTPSNPRRIAKGRILIG